MKLRREVFTTGEVAKLCHVAPRTVTKWFDAGELGGYRIPGSRDRRIPAEELVRFMKVHNLPMDGLDLGPAKVLLVGEKLSAEFAGDGSNWETLTAHRAFEAGVAALQHRPEVILFDLSERAEEALAACRVVRTCSELSETKVLAVVDPADRRVSPARRSELVASGFHGLVTRPIDVEQLRSALRQAM
jgi:excisionase family DNA binding protein